MDLWHLLPPMAVASLISFFLGFFLGRIIKRKEDPAEPPQTVQTQELSEFLNDIRNRGFSFVRVDPDSVFLRAPKGKDS